MVLWPLKTSTGALVFGPATIPPTAEYFAGGPSVINPVTEVHLMQIPSMLAAARGGRGGRSSAHVVVVAGLARCAHSGRCSWRFATVVILAPHPKYDLFTWPPHHAPQAV